MRVQSVVNIPVVKFQYGLNFYINQNIYICDLWSSQKCCLTEFHFQVAYQSAEHLSEPIEIYIH